MHLRLLALAPLLALLPLAPAVEAASSSTRTASTPAAGSAQAAAAGNPASASGSSASASSSPGATATTTRRIQGIDVSKYQHSTGLAIDWGKVKRAGHTFAFVKATGGSNRIDPWFTREWAAARRAGMITGAYHYADPSRSAEAQAALIVSVVGSTREAGNLGIVLDIESTGGLGPSQLNRWAHTFLRSVERRTGRVPILYTYPNFWNSKMGGGTTFGAYPLWLARYSSAAPAPLRGWNRWTFWQRSSSTRVPGIVGDVDHNIFCCSAATLNALADGRSIRITKVWRALGGASGRLGLPLGPEAAVPGGWGQVFEKGYVAATNRGTFAVTGAVWDRYRAIGGVKSRLGVPVGPARTVAPGVTEQRFAAGRIVHSAATGAHSMSGGVLVRWVEENGATGQVGLPVAEPTTTGQQFVGGGLYLTPKGVRLVPGAIRDHYEELGGTTSFYGLPVAEAYDVLGGRAVDFQLGQLIEFDLAGQKVVV